VNRVVVRVPASSANLGPGFDVLAAALDLHLEAEVAETGRFRVETTLSIARDRRNLCVRGFARLLDPDRYTFHIRSDVPLSGGLGTSAAAVVAGLVAARQLGGDRDAPLLELAAEQEGHPDNAAAALLGGFVVCTEGRAERIDPPPGLECVLVVPEEPVRTAAARAALPPQVPIGDAVFNVGHAAMLVLGLARGDLDLVAHGLADRVHQDRRAHLFPRSAGLVRDAASLGALGATISGAGPTVLVWTRAEDTNAVQALVTERAAGWADVLRVPFAVAGAEVL